MKPKKQKVDTQTVSNNDVVKETYFQRRKRLKIERKKIQQANKDLIADIVPIINSNKEGSYFILEDGTLMDFYGIVCKDLANISEDLSMLDSLSFDKIYKTYESPMKIISFNFPTDTTVQLAYARHLYNKTENPVYRQLLERRMFEAEYVNENRTDKEFCLFFYAKDEDMLREKRASIYGILSGSMSATALVERLDYEKKLQVLYKLFNPIDNLQA